MAQVFDPSSCSSCGDVSAPTGAPIQDRSRNSSRDVFSIERPTVSEYETALAALKDFQAAIDKLFDSVDVIVTPTVTMTAPPIAGPIDGMKILRNTWPFNAAGTPAISIPVSGTAAPGRAPTGRSARRRRQTVTNSPRVRHQPLGTVRTVRTRPKPRHILGGCT